MICKKTFKLTIGPWKMKMSIDTTFLSLLSTPSQMSRCQQSSSGVIETHLQVTPMLRDSKTSYQIFKASTMWISVILTTSGGKTLGMNCTGQ